jgi:ferredoxin-type protein NapH
VETMNGVLLGKTAVPPAPTSGSLPRKGLWAANRWLILRRASQFGILGFFLLGPLTGVWLIKGNLSSSLTLGVLPLTDPLQLLQMLASGHWPYRDALIGAGLVAGFYALVGGRVYCSWVCPVNLVTDAAAWLRRKLGLKGGHAPATATRYWILGGVMLASALTGGMVWELINPVSLLQRGLIFGIGAGWLLILAIFVYDLLLANRGWCGHVCPMGACYRVIGEFAPLRVAAARRDTCDDCMDCFTVCPEPQVIRPALKGSGSPRITNAECTNCGRCIDVCALDVFRFTTPFSPDLNRRTTP